MKIIRTVGICGLLLLWVLLTAFLWFGSKEDYTYSERRPLAQMPGITANSIFSGKFAADFEDFTLDQFPFRDSVRKIKSLFHYYVLNQSDNNGIYLVDGTVAKLHYPMNKASVAYAAGRLQYLCERYLAGTDCRVYASLIPDKGYFLAEQNGYPAMDYGAMEAAFQDALAEAAYVDIKDSLSAESYYRTDTHWRQEKLLPVAQSICNAMGAEASAAYTQVKVEVPFYGVYFGQAALPMEPEELYIMESAVLDACIVTDPITGAASKVYNTDKTGSPDLYDVFLSGAQPLLVIDNPSGTPGRELVLFRDSYGSSLAPLLAQGYSKITLVDIRYIDPDWVGDFLTFTDQDVLFLYSTLILNNGRSLK